jgi:AcrR family transcriptional regulator
MANSETSNSAKRSSKRASNDIVSAAFRLAASRPWGEVGLADIASEAKIPLSELAAQIGGKSDVLKRYARQLDQEMLASIEREPVTGSPHDRVFDIVMRRLELMEKDKPAIRSIVAHPASTITDYAVLAGSVLQSQDWVLSAAGLEDTGLRGAIKTTGLAVIYARILKVWANEEDEGLARTMAQLDRSLRDGASWFGRLNTPVTLVAAVGGLARGFMKARREGPSSSNGRSSSSAPETS